jgi:membrane-associated protease RseP (regulator of RpoE activity)
MNSSPGLRTLALATLLALAATGMARAEDGKEKRIEKRRIVVINEDGKEKVIEGDGPMVRRGFLGVSLTELTPELRTHFGVPDESGVMVSKVEAGSPAEKAGLKVGDIISRIDGKAVESSWDVSARVRDYEEGQQAPLEVWRNGKVMTLTAAITLKERPEMDMGPMFLKTKDGGDLMLHLPGNGAHLRMGPGPDGHPGMPGPGPDGEPQIRIERLERLRSPREAELEKKLQALEKRLNELEAQLKQKR